MTIDAPRPTLSEEGLRTAAADLPWRPLEVVASTGSTNADVAERAERGAAEGLVLAADEQTAGRGRLGRSWSSPPGASVSVSLLLRPNVPGESLGWLPLLAGLAVATALRGAAGADAVLKWPNDVLVRGGRPGKVAGVLLERSGTAAVIGFGINTAMTQQELPVPEASSVLLSCGAAPEPDALVAACLGELHDRYQRFTASAGDADRSGLAAEYRRSCATLGSQVSVLLPTGERYEGTATDVDGAGRLQVAADGDVRVVAAGDVTHLR